MSCCLSAGETAETEEANNVGSAKKTKGRVKIKMEFIDNKLRRYTTFSKRKTGIMKKVSFTLTVMTNKTNMTEMTNLTDMTNMIDMMEFTDNKLRRFTTFSK